MVTQKFMGKNQLVKRLTAQVGSEGMAIAILNKRGDMKGSKLTAAGKKRDNMTAEQRAKDRVGGNPDKLKYNPKTNRATRVGKK